MLRLFETHAQVQDDELALRALRLLVQALELNLLTGRGLHAENLKANLNQLLGSLEQKQEAAVVVENAAEACAGVQHYFRHLGASIESLASELTVGIRVLEEALEDLSGEQASGMASGVASGMERLDQVQQRLANQRGLDDVHLLRKHLEECVRQLREELQAQRHLQERRVAALGRAMGALRGSAEKLPVGQAAIAFAVLRLKSMERIEARFGSGVADAMVELLRETLRAKWPGAVEQAAPAPHALLLVDRQDLDLEKHRQMLRRIAAERLTYSATIDDNEHLLPLHLDWLVAHAHSPEQMQKLVENFLAGNSAGKV
ncbi:MAG: hypothetical protein NW208_06480 [Bryobacter sp.]|nr:hypothetical protein [Bryobacter sp.]